MDVHAAPGQFGLDGCIDYFGRIAGAKQEVSGIPDSILHHDQHVDDVLVPGDELRGEGLCTPQHSVRKLSANDQAAELPDFELEYSVDRPGQREMKAGQNPWLDYRAKASHHSLLIRCHQVQTRENPKSREAQHNAPSAAHRRRSVRDCVSGYGQRTAHFTPASPRVRTFSSSESELRIAVVLSSSTFL